jgi:carboxyl-terminal processing protease
MNVPLKVVKFSMPRVKTILTALLFALFVLPAIGARPQAYNKDDRGLAEEMLKNVAADVKKHYYDAQLHGVDWDGKVREAKRNIDAAQSMDGAISEIAALLDSLNDSHTVFYPPPRRSTHDYGFTMKMIGDHCFVTRVRPASDAAKKGLKAGDEILAVNDHPVSRATVWRLKYIYEVLRPQPGLRLTLAESSGQPRQLEVLAEVKTSAVLKYFLDQGANQSMRDREAQHHSLRARYFEKGNELLLVKIPQFAFSAEETDNVIANMRKHKGVVLDLRGNPGGFTDTLDRLLGGMFQYDQKIGDRIDRGSTEPVIATGRHHDAFTGRFAVLIDGQSASASEIFARVIQLERRGFVLGDRSAGMVMESKFYPHQVSVDSAIFYGAQITRADLVMTDGKSLEHVGVEPDILILPTTGDLANNEDPAMAKAAGLVGGKLSPEEAGTAFPFEESNID